MPYQRLTITLDGITASDYMAWVANPEPPALGHALRSVSTRYEPLGGTLVAELWWNAPVPAPRVAAAAAGLPLTPEVVAVTAQGHEVAARRALPVRLAA